MPAELTTAALRRARTIDPAIRDFIEIAENQWDFTDPTRIPGFEPLEATDEIGRGIALSVLLIAAYSRPFMGENSVKPPQASHGERGPFWEPTVRS